MNEPAEFLIDRKDMKNKRSRYICSNDGGNILTLYVRVFGFHNARLFEAINMFQCDKCFQFYAMIDGTRNLIPLVVTRKEFVGEKK